MFSFWISPSHCSLRRYLKSAVNAPAYITYDDANNASPRRHVIYTSMSFRDWIHLVFSPFRDWIRVEARSTFFYVLSTSF